MIHLLCEELIQYISERFDSGYEALIWQFNLRCTCMAMRHNTIVFPEIILNPYRFKFTPAIFSDNNDLVTGFDIDEQQWRHFDMKVFTNYIKRGSVHIYFSFWINKYMWFKNRKFYLSNNLDMFSLDTKRVPKTSNKLLLTTGISDFNTSCFLTTCLKNISTNIFELSLQDVFTEELCSILTNCLPSTQITKLNLSNNNFTKTMYTQIYKAGLKLEHLNLSHTYFGCGWFNSYELAVWYDFILKCKLQVLKTDIPGLSPPKNEKNEGWTLYYDSFMECVNNSSIKSLHIFCKSTICEWHEYVGMVAKNYDFFNLEKVVLNGETISFPQHCILCKVLQTTSLNEVQDFIKSQMSQKQFLIRIPIPVNDAKVTKRERCDQQNAKVTKRERYDQRNAYRNQYLQENRKCKACGFSWPKGSIKIQTFEGIQSKCNRGLKLCSETSHAAGFWKPNQ